MRQALSQVPSTSAVVFFDGASSDGAPVGDCGAFVELPNAIEHGTLPAASLRAAVSRILSFKSSAGVMRTPIEPASTDRLASSLDAPHTRALARLAAERGAVLLLNKHETLPLVPSSSGRSTKQRRLRILVSGNAGGCGVSDGDGEKAAQGEPLCPAQSLLLGSYTSLLSARRAHVPTIAGALRTALKGEHTVTYSPGIATAGSGREEEEDQRAARAAAVNLAKRSDAIILALGDTASTAGEWSDRSSFELPTSHAALLHALGAIGKPLILVLIGGRPTTFGGARGDMLLANTSSLLFSFPTGQEGAEAISRILVGEASPGGRLAHAWPRHAGPSTWLQPISGKWRTHTWRHAAAGGGGVDGGGGRDAKEEEGLNEGSSRYGSYVDSGVPSPLFPFGYGLSYHRCILQHLTIASTGGDDVGGSSAAVTATIARASLEVRPAAASLNGCTEVVQCYARDPIMKHIRREKRLVAFSRVELQPGERLRHVRLNLTSESMALLDDVGKWRVMPGEYELSCGVSSADPSALEARWRVW